MFKSTSTNSMANITSNPSQETKRSKLKTSHVRNPSNNMEKIGNMSF